MNAGDKPDNHLDLSLVLSTVYHAGLRCMRAAQLVKWASPLKPRAKYHHSCERPNFNHDPSTCAPLTFLHMPTCPKARPKLNVVFFSHIFFFFICATLQVYSRGGHITALICSTVFLIWFVCSACLPTSCSFCGGWVPSLILVPRQSWAQEKLCTSSTVSNRNPEAGDRIYEAANDAKSLRVYEV